jgi:hypothetical protein
MFFRGLYVWVMMTKWLALYVLHVVGYLAWRDTVVNTRDALYVGNETSNIQ